MYVAPRSAAPPIDSTPEATQLTLASMSLRVAAVSAKASGQQSAATSLPLFGWRTDARVAFSLLMGAGDSVDRGYEQALQAVEALDHASAKYSTAKQLVTFGMAQRDEMVANVEPVAQALIGNPTRKGAEISRDFMVSQIIGAADTMIAVADQLNGLLHGPGAA